MLLIKKFSIWVTALIVLKILFILIILGFFLHITKDLPDYKQLEEYNPPGITRFYTTKGELINEYAKEKRIYVKYKDIPKKVVEAFISAEDKNFFKHSGIDFYSILRASIQNILNIGTNKRLVGGSTITQQVVKDFLLTNERTIIRKIKEAVLAYRISNVYSKERILELYLNQIFFGNKSYGIATAAQNYFCKELKDLDVADAALLASLPKAPSYLNPYKNYERALLRRDWVIGRMREEIYITKQEELEAIKEPINLKKCKYNKRNVETFYSDVVKQKLIKIFGEEQFYTWGFVVNTNIDNRLQNFAEISLKNGLKNFDKKLGWRKSLGKINLESANLKKEFDNIKKKVYCDKYLLAAISKVTSKYLEVTFQTGEKGKIYIESLKWAIKNANLNDQEQVFHSLKQLFKKGDVILVEYDSTKNSYKLEQIPEVNGAIIVLEVKSGKVLAIAGGYDIRQSSFNRAIQAKRQPGSAFKPFVYLSALEEGISPNTLILDEPLSVNLGYGMPDWEPRNYGRNFLGLITLRTAFEKSRNIPTIRLLLSLGLDKIVEVATRYKIYNNVTVPTYSMALGAFETTLLRITNAYASVANSGFMNKPKFIDSVYDRNGRLIYKNKDTICYGICDELQKNINESNEILEIPSVEYIGKAMTDSASNYQLLSMFEGSVERGTSRRAKSLKRVQGGKTGTTNDSLDAWYIGFTPDIAVGVFVGYDIPRSLGKNASGATVALPIYVDFMRKAAKYMPDSIFDIPNTIEKTLVDYTSGKYLSSTSESENGIYEVFKKNELSQLDSDLSKAKDNRKFLNNNTDFEKSLEQLGKELDLNSIDGALDDFDDEEDALHGIY